MRGALGTKSRRDRIALDRRREWETDYRRDRRSMIYHTRSTANSRPETGQDEHEDGPVGTCGIPKAITERSMVRIVLCQLLGAIVATPCGTTQVVVTRGHLMIECNFAVRGKNDMSAECSTRYEVAGHVSTSLLDVVWITAAHVCVNAAQLKLVLLVNISAADELQRKYAKSHCVLVEDLTVFCLKTSLRFASRSHCILLQNLTAFCFKLSLHFASISLRFAQDLHCILLEDHISIDQGPFELGTTRDALGTTPEGGVLLGPERPRTYEDLSDTENKRYDADVQATNIVIQGLPKDIYKLINHNIEAKATWDNVKMLLASSELTKEDRESQLYDKFERFKMLPGENVNEYYVRFHKLVNDIRNIRMTMPNIQLNFKFVNKNRAGNANAGQGKSVKCYNYNGVGHIARNCTQPKRPQNSDYFKDKMLLMQAQENGAVLDEEELLFLASEQGNTFDVDVDNQPIQDLALNEDNIFQADECDAFDSDVDDELTAQSIFMANLSSVRSANLQAGPSNASILSEVHILENDIYHSVFNQDEHEIHNKVQPSNVIDSTSVYMGNSNVIPYEQYLSVNDISVVPSCTSFALNSVCVPLVNDVIVPHDPIAIELKIYKETGAFMRQRAKLN
ncbi:retrovirus-related pol polyprotein from transposon TNT 1-94 [Tanacetum coccineum]